MSETTAQNADHLERQWDLIVYLIRRYEGFFDNHFGLPVDLVKPLL